MWGEWGGVENPGSGGEGEQLFEVVGAEFLSPIVFEAAVPEEAEEHFFLEEATWWWGEGDGFAEGGREEGLGDGEVGDIEQFEEAVEGGAGLGISDSGIMD